MSNLRTRDRWRVSWISRRSDPPANPSRLVGTRSECGAISRHDEVFFEPHVVRALGELEAKLLLEPETRSGPGSTQRLPLRRPSLMTSQPALEGWGQRVVRLCKSCGQPGSRSPFISPTPSLARRSLNYLLANKVNRSTTFQPCLSASVEKNGPDFHRLAGPTHRNHDRSDPKHGSVLFAMST